MLNRRHFIASAAATTAFALAPTFAFAKTPAFTEAAFKAAQKDGKSILIEIHASWCPTCKAQAPILNGLLETPKFKDVVSFRVDFDDQADQVRAFGAQTQSTLIVFKGTKEMGRSVGDTDPASIEALLATGV
jgi:thioredoxin 1